MTPDQEALVDKARRGLRAAEMLLREGEPEIAASRAYYAMFHAAEAMLLGRGLSFSRHSAVMSAFGREFVRSGALSSEFHRWLLDAFDARNIGDYEIHQRLTTEQAAEHVRRARAFVDQAERLLHAG